MAHMLFDALNGVQLDNHTVQTILETTTLSHDVSSGVKLIAGPPTTITLDEEDVFQCGKCKKQFTSFALFMCHKKEHSTGDLLNESPDNCGDLGPSESSNFQQLQVQALDSSITANELCQRIILSEADILSFSIDDDNALNLSSTQASASLSNVQNDDSFLAPNAETPIGKVLQDTSVTISDNYNANLNNQPVILTQETSQNAFTSSPLHNIHSISPTNKEISTDSSSKDMSHNINILATYPDTHPKGCKVLLSSDEFIEGNVENGTLFLECDKIPDKILQYTSSSIEADGTVLLDYAEGNAKKTCKVLLTNGEYTETSIEYIDGTNSACEFPGLSNGGNTEGGEEIVAVSLLDVIESPVALELSEAINDVNSEQMTVQEENISLAIPDTSRCSNTKSDKVCPENLPDGNNRSQGVKNAKLKCSYCNKMFAKNFDLNQHMRSHTGEKPFQCVVCGRAFSQKSNVKKHMATHKVWPAGLSRTLPKEPLQRMEKSANVDEQMHGNSCDENGSVIVIDRSYVCQYCDSAFPSYYELKTHMKKHSHQKVYKCVQRNCQKTFEDLNVFLIHTRQHTNDVQYCCHVCFKKFNTLEELGVHQQTHDPNDRANVKKPRYYLCVKCKSKFTSSKALDQHLSTTNHHFPCSHCGKVFACERYLRRHLPTHGAPASFVCSVCGKGFRTEQYLNIHRIIHSGDRPHTCMHCPAAFNRKDKLARHLLIHQSVKKFKCPFNNFLGCSKEFNRRDKLKLHILTHSAVKPFHCWKCNKMFHKQHHLRDHEKSHHSADIPFSCSRCGLSFKKKINLSTHLCNDEGSPDEPESVAESQYRGDMLEIESSRPSRGRKLRKIRSKKALASTVDSVEKVAPSTEVARLKDSQTMGPDSEDIADADSVPTIEIIVMPMHVNHRNGNEGNKNVYVMFPASSNDEEVPIKSLQSSLISTLNNSSKCVPEGHSDHTITNIEGMDDLVVGM